MLLSRDNFIIRSMDENDRANVLEMMDTFYSSEAILGDPDPRIFVRDFEECVTDSPFVDGFIFTDLEGNVKGYSMIVHSYSTEFGKPVVWIEDMYLEEDLRGLGAASAFFGYLEHTYPDHVHRLEAERSNEHAIEVYKRNGFKELPYFEMIRGI